MVLSLRFANADMDKKGQDQKTPKWFKSLAIFTPRN
jgi:hypothetical protein